jgi:hypothetical protein
VVLQGRWDGLPLQFDAAGAAPLPWVDGAPTRHGAVKLHADFGDARLDVDGRAADLFHSRMSGRFEAAAIRSPIGRLLGRCRAPRPSRGGGVTRGEGLAPGARALRDRQQPLRASLALDRAGPGGVSGRWPAGLIVGRPGAAADWLADTLRRGESRRRHALRPCAASRRVEVDLAECDYHCRRRRGALRRTGRARRRAGWRARCRRR